MRWLDAARAMLSRQRRASDTEIPGPRLEQADTFAPPTAAGWSRWTEVYNPATGEHSWFRHRQRPGTAALDVEESRLPPDRSSYSFPSRNGMLLILLLLGACWEAGDGALYDAVVTGL